MVLEEKSRKRSRKQNIQQVILSSVALAGIVSVSLIAPNAMQGFRFVGLGKRHSRFFQHSTNRARNRLVEKGLLEYVEGKKYIQLTEKGRKQLRVWGLADYEIKKPRRWDKKWRILIFDVKESRRAVRDKLRLVLSKMGFYKLQQSVWIYPYDCEEFAQLLKVDFKVGWDVLYIIADQVENESRLRQHFQLD